MKRLALWYIFFTVSLGLVIFASRQAYTLETGPQMATFTVNSTADAVDASPGDGICATSGGVCTLRAAVQETNALAGVDTVTVPAGTYLLTIPGTAEDQAATGDLDITDGLILNGADPATTIVDGGALDHVFHVQTNHPVTLTGLTIQNGNAPYPGGGGIWATSDTQLIIINCHIVNNSSIMRGGGIFSEGNLITIINSDISHNTSQWAGGGLSSADASAIIQVTNSTFRENSNYEIYAAGGGASLYGSVVEISRTQFINNQTNNVGGALHFSGDNAIVSINETDFLQNTADSWGGAMYLTGLTQTVSIANSHFESNQSTAGPGGAIGLYNNAQVATETGLALHITNSSFASNTANSWGGAIHAQGYTITVAITGSEFIENVGSSGGVIGLYGPGPTVTTTGVTAHITGTTFSANTAVSGGGAIRAGIGTLTTIINAAFIQNTSGGDGGAAHFSADGMTGFATAHIANSTFSSNQAALSGGAIYGYSMSTNPYFRNVTIAYNTADSDNNGSGDGGGFSSVNNASFYFSNSIIANNNDSGNEAPDCLAATGGASGQNNLIGKTDGCHFTGIYNLTGTIASPLNPHLDPLTGSPAYHPLSLNSPAIDAGFPAPPTNDPDYFANCRLTDQIGTVRPIDGNRDGEAICDMGAVEAPERIGVVVEPTMESSLVYTDTQGNPTTIVVPVGAVTETTVLLFTPVASATPPAPLLFAGHAFDLEAYINGVLQAGFTFNLPVSITITYADEEVDGLNEDSLVLLFEDGSAWGNAACATPVANAANNLLTTLVCHLSRFALFGQPGEMRVYLPMVLRP